LADADCCVTPVLNVQEAQTLPHFVARGMWVEVETAPGQHMTQMAMPVQMSDYVFEVRRSAPAQGQHTDEVLREAGWDATAIAQWRAHKVVA
jgi:crotonobetainyl-CoA:carnitine CoA-transferase CaiB-like acyl-CoA transferase